MVADIWNAITTSGSSVVSWIVNLFQGLAAIFYAPGSGSESGSLTFIGIFAIIALTVSVAFVVIKWISSFISLNRS